MKGSTFSRKVIKEDIENLDMKNAPILKKTLKDIDFLNIEKKLILHHEEKNYIL